jgi:hypothetical protein
MDILSIPYSPIKSINTRTRLNYIKKKYKITGIRYIKQEPNILNKNLIY